ncbi:MAG TPA: response regulator [Pirellulales bacterium]|nr:response regulator [Pirellulales bacterium]
MLVLSRRSSQKIVFPTVGATVEVLQIRGQTVRLGISAPNDVPVLRQEVQSAAGEPLAVSQHAPPDTEVSRRLRHLMRNQLNLTSVGLALLRGLIAQERWGEIDETIDRLEREIAAAQERCESLERPAPAKAGAPGFTALVVEDDQNERELLAGFLRISGFSVATASDGADALDYLSRQRRPDVVLLDMTMPRCDGPTTVRQIRTDPRWQGLKIFAVSGASRSEVPVGIGPTGLDGWFSKPLDPQSMLRRLSRELTAPHA